MLENIATERNPGENNQQIEEKNIIDSWYNVDLVPTPSPPNKNKDHILFFGASTQNTHPPNIRQTFQVFPDSSSTTRQQILEAWVISNIDIYGNMNTNPLD